MTSITHLFTSSPLRSPRNVNGRGNEWVDLGIHGQIHHLHMKTSRDDRTIHRIFHWWQQCWGVVGSWIGWRREALSSEKWEWLTWGAMTGEVCDRNISTELRWEKWDDGSGQGKRGLLTIIAWLDHVRGRKSNREIHKIDDIPKSSHIHDLAHTWSFPKP